MIGSDLGHFRITDRLGEGGMGSVYRASDTKLGREVAIKVLPEVFSADPERVARFEREARVLASLNHPNIAGIYEVGDTEVASQGGAGRTRVTYLVMELAEGETLADRLARGAMPLDEALRVALQIALGFEAAHRRGIVHRDLKPANVAVGAKGVVKVLDFGLAKALETTADSAAGGRAGLTNSPTLTARMTMAGVILGTAAYMSPEQAKGEEADKRSDNWSFGVLLWEMLTGQRAFAQNTVSETLAAVLMREPDLAQLPATTPYGIRRLLGRLLQKDPEQRLHDIADARIEIEAALRGEGIAAPAADTPELARTGWGWKAAALLLALAVLGLAGLDVQRRPAPERVVRASVLPPEGMQYQLGGSQPGAVAVSRDGSSLAFTAAAAGGSPTLWVRRVDSLVPRQLAGTENARYPFWSPDGRWIGYIDGSSLKKVPVDGGPPIELCPARNGKGATWSPAGLVVFAPTPNGGLWAVPETGGEPRRLTELTGDETSHRHPRFLPDGEHFLYFVRRPAVGLIRVGSLSSDPGKDLVETRTNAEFAAGRLLFVWKGSLMAQPFDPHRLELSGEARPLVEDILQINGAALAVFSASAGGTLAYQTGPDGDRVDLVWFDRNGTESKAVPESPAPLSFRLSPDELRVAVEISDSETWESDLWIWDLERGVRNRFTHEPTGEFRPVWSPDGAWLAFASNRQREGGVGGVYKKAVAGTAEAELLASAQGLPEDWSPDGALIVVRVEERGQNDLAVVPAAGGERRPVLFTEFDEESPDISPDGRWMAYASNETGQREVYVTSFPEPGRRWRISVDGGRDPVWRGDGREIFFRSGDGLFVVEVDASGDEVVAGSVTRLFDMPERLTDFRDFDVSADGQRIIAARSSLGRNLTPIQLVVNWDAELP